MRIDLDHGGRVCGNVGPSQSRLVQLLRCETKIELCLGIGTPLGILDLGDGSTSRQGVQFWTLTVFLDSREELAFDLGTDDDEIWVVLLHH